MAKPVNNLSNVAAMASESDLKALRTFQTQKPVARPEKLFSCGHNVILDLRNPLELVLRMGLDETAFENLLPTQKADGTPGAVYLGRTAADGARYNSVPLSLNGKSWFLSASLQLWVPKKK